MPQRPSGSRVSVGAPPHQIGSSKLNHVGSKLASHGSQEQTFASPVLILDAMQARWKKVAVKSQDSSERAPGLGPVTSNPMISQGKRRGKAPSQKFHLQNASAPYDWSDDDSSESKHLPSERMPGLANTPVLWARFAD